MVAFYIVTEEEPLIQGSCNDKKAKMHLSHAGKPRLNSNGMAWAGYGVSKNG